MRNQSWENDSFQRFTVLPVECRRPEPTVFHGRLWGRCRSRMWVTPASQRENPKEIRPGFVTPFYKLEIHLLSQITKVDQKSNTPRRIFPQFLIQISSSQFREITPNVSSTHAPVGQSSSLTKCTMFHHVICYFCTIPCPTDFRCVCRRFQPILDTHNCCLNTNLYWKLICILRCSHLQSSFASSGFQKPGMADFQRFCMP